MILTDLDIQQRILVHIAKNYKGKQNAFAKDIKMQPCYLGMIINGKRPVSEKVLTAIGLRNVVTVSYEEVKP